MTAKEAKSAGKHGGLRRWLVLAAGVVVAGVVALLAGCCCSHQQTPAPAHGLPPVSAIVLPVPEPVAASPDTVIDAEMRNIDFHFDDTVILRIRHLRARVVDLAGEHILVLDDDRRFVFNITYAEMGLTGASLSDALNRYVFGYEGSPLRNLSIRTVGKQIEQSGILHKVVDIPFTMRADVSATPEGLVRIRPTSMKICSIPGLGLLDALNVTLEELIDVSKAAGVTVKGNDLFLDPTKILPPPRVAGHLTGIRVVGDEVVELFGEPGAPGAEPLAPPVAAPNYVYFRGGTVRFGKLYMVRTSLEAIDADPTDPFDFYLDYYMSQLVAGYHRTMADGSLVAWMPDFAALGTPEGRVAPPR